MREWNLFVGAGGTFSVDSNTYKANNAVCEKEDSKDRSIVYLIERSGENLSLTETSTNSEKDSQLCGSSGLVKFKAKKIASSDKATPNGVEITPSPTPTPEASPTPDPRTILDMFEVSPSAGTYASGVVVKFAPKTEEESSFERQKGDGSWETVFSGSCLGGVESSYTCITVNTTETLTLRRNLPSMLGTEEFPNATQQLSYTINPLPKNVTINAAEYQEDYTECAVSENNGVKKPSGRAKILNTTALGANTVAWLYFSVNDISQVGQSLVQTDSSSSGLTIAGSGDTPGSSAVTFYPGRNSASPTDQCAVKLVEFAPGTLAKGEISCALTQDPMQFQCTLRISRTFT